MLAHEEQQVTFHLTWSNSVQMKQQQRSLDIIYASWVYRISWWVTLYPVLSTQICSTKHSGWSLNSWRHDCKTASIRPDLILNEEDKKKRLLVFQCSIKTAIEFWAFESSCHLVCLQCLCLHKPWKIFSILFFKKVLAMVLGSWHSL